MSQRGMCSRREADRYIERGWVRVDGEIVDQLGSKVSEDQMVTLEKQAQQQQNSLATVILNKPPGYVSGTPEKGYEAAVMLITGSNQFHSTSKSRAKPPDRHGLAPAGRLDIDSRGLIVFTQDGRVARRLIGADSRIEKEYLVNVIGEITEDKLKQLRYGLSLDGHLLRWAGIERMQGQQIRFILREGKKRQIRRMCEQVDLGVNRLNRIRIGGVKLGKLPEGKWRFLRDDEKF